MSERFRPRKPKRDPTHIVFPEKGAPYFVVEQLPRDQEGLELTVGRKFLGALRQFEGIELERLARGLEPADLTCRSLDGTAIQLQIVEVIDQRLRELLHMRASYRDVLVQMLGDDLRLFSGCRVSLVDSGDPPYLPNVTSTDGRECLRLLVEHILTVGADIHTLELRKNRVRETHVTTPARTVGVLVKRFVAAGESVPVDFSWTGAGPSYRTDVPRGLLPTAVQSKINKRYAKPASTRFWLLAYSVDSLLSKDDPDITESQRLLETLYHPFDQVWFLFAYAEKNLGALVHVWPTKRDG